MSKLSRISSYKQEITKNQKFKDTILTQVSHNLVTYFGPKVKPKQARSRPIKPQIKPKHHSKSPQIPWHIRDFSVIKGVLELAWWLAWYLGHHPASNSTLSKLWYINHYRRYGTSKNRYFRLDRLDELGQI